MKRLTDTVNQQACEMKIYESDMMGRLTEVAKELRQTMAETKNLGAELTRKKDEIRQLKKHLELNTPDGETRGSTRLIDMQT